MCPGPKAGSPGAQAISDCHKGARPHDKHGGFAKNHEMAKICGKRGGDKVKWMYTGTDFYNTIGTIGGKSTLRMYGQEHFKRIGRIGGLKRGERLRAKAANKASEDS